MPKLIDAIGKMSFNNKIVAPEKIYKTANSLQHYFPLEKLTIKNKLKTELVVGDAGNIKKYCDTIERDDTIFASWCSKLNKSPKTDCFKRAPINDVKPVEEINENKVISEAYRFSEWQRRADAVINHYLKR